MNKKIFSINVSLALHLAFLIVALNTVIYTFIPRASGDTPPLVRVRIDSKLLSLSAANQDRQISRNNLTYKPPEIAISAPTSIENPSDVFGGRVSTVISSPQIKAVVANGKSLAIIKEAAPDEKVPQSLLAGRSSQAAVVSTRDVAKDLMLSSGYGAKGPGTPFFQGHKVSVINEQQLQGHSLGPTMLQGPQNYSPHLAFEHAANAQDIRNFLGYELRTYEDPSDHSQYFKLTIRVGEIPGTLSAIPKKIIFLVDSSNSIGAVTLKQIKEGVEDCLGQLSPQDKFNLIVFKNTPVKMSQGSLAANNPENIRKATMFLDDVRAGSTTDVYEAVLNSIDLKSSMRPTYIFLLSDGQPTVGIIDPQQIINQTADINKGRIPIFAFGTGIFLDRYLMNFLSFTNRGWAEFEPNDIESGIVNMYNHIKDPVLLNLRYYVSGLDEKEIYPKLLPDLFKGSQFVLYGRYTKERLFYFQLFGDARDGLKQYLISDDISQSIRGDKRIAQEWAIRKVYYLIGLLEYNKNNQVLVNQIKELQKKFHLKIPSYEVKGKDKKL